mmetsp:Transcript_7459/g.14904  ORF Transcript_7459/g.14904 Transcript_7459/m.14904 type:complete len:93 (-) Transcript_7459:108-386(-)
MILVDDYMYLRVHYVPDKSFTFLEAVINTGLDPRAIPRRDIYEKLAVCVEGRYFNGRKYDIWSKSAIERLVKLVLMSTRTISLLLMNRMILR